jgi:hypothetical protein
MSKFDIKIVLVFVLLSSSSFVASSKICDVLNPSHFAARGGFSAPVDSSVTWKSAGYIKADKLYLCPYLYTRIWGKSGRATSRLVIFDENYNYLGSYGLTSPLGVHIKNNKLFIINMMGKGDFVIFRSNDLPDKIYIDGEYVELFR